MTISLPFPPSKLSPNARCHWGVRARAFKAYRGQCLLLLRQHRDMLAGRSQYEVTFHPPAAHRYDRDGLISRFKAGQDALAEVAGVDDYHFVMAYKFGEPVKGGAVIVEAA